MQERPFFNDPGGRSKIERGSRREADEIDLVRRQILFAAKLQWHQGHASGQGHRTLSQYIETIEILRGDGLIGADVKNVDPL